MRVCARIRDARAFDVNAVIFYHQLKRVCRRVSFCQMCFCARSFFIAAAAATTGAATADAAADASIFYSLANNIHASAHKSRTLTAHSC